MQELGLEPASQFDRALLRGGELLRRGEHDDIRRRIGAELVLDRLDDVAVTDRRGCLQTGAEERGEGDDTVALGDRMGDPIGAPTVEEPLADRDQEA